MKIILTSSSFIKVNGSAPQLLDCMLFPNTESRPSWPLKSHSQEGRVLLFILLCARDITYIIHAARQKAEVSSDRIMSGGQAFELNSHMILKPKCQLSCPMSFHWIEDMG
jgi:hypothetical protein